MQTPFNSLSGMFNLLAVFEVTCFTILVPNAFNASVDAAVRTAPSLTDLMAAISPGAKLDQSMGNAESNNMTSAAPDAHKRRPLE